MVRKYFDNEPLKDVKIMDEWILFFSRVSLSIFSLEALYISWVWGVFILERQWNAKSQVFQNKKLAGDLASRLDWVASSRRKQTELPNWNFCPVVLQLAWLFIFSACFTRVHHLATCQSRVLVASPCYFAQTWAFLHTFSHTTLTWFPPKYMITNC